VSYQDLDGKPQELRAEGFLARVIQHEMDHLSGVLFVDRFSPADKIRVRAQLEELEARHRRQQAAAKG
jgi:peptide deformylase